MASTSPGHTRISCSDCIYSASGSTPVAAFAAMTDHITYSHGGDPHMMEVLRRYLTATEAELLKQVK